MPSSRTQRYFFPAILAFFCFTYLLLELQTKPSPWETYEWNATETKLLETNVKTHKGFVTLDEINEKVYRPLGYQITEYKFPIPKLQLINEATCDTVFSEWLKVSREPQPETPPKSIPGWRMNEFLMNGYAGLDSYYFNDKNAAGSDKPHNWDRISKLMKYSKMDLANLAYGIESASVYHAMAAHRLDEMSGVVIGSMQPWVEVMALRHGAKHILTVEYNQLTIEEQFKDRLSSILPVDLVNNWNDYADSFDFAASFSSIEHSGLGRYGDPLDPIGDLREMLKIRCLLKKGGLLFLGLPFGTDAIQYNAHRIYGSIRLGMMMTGFEWLATYSGESPEAFEFNSTRLHYKGTFGLTQYTMVLRKL
uniref:Methyltransf_11 domain-containing protein n=1 Tax=Caenorhabditis tropicalis TaxID=1561998 RepID=A0A1I7UTW8_9PELO